MVDKPKRYNYFSPPRLSVFQTELPARDADSQKSGRKRRFFQSISESQFATSQFPGPIPCNYADDKTQAFVGADARGGTRVKSTLSSGNQKTLDQNVTFEISRAEKDQNVFGESTVSNESPTHNHSFIDEHEMESTFCLSQAEDITFTIPANEKSNSSVLKTQTLKMHLMVPRQTGKSALQNSSIIGARSKRFFQSPEAKEAPQFHSAISGVRRSMRIKSEQNTPPLSAILESPPRNIPNTKSASRLARMDLTKSQLSSSCLSSMTESSAACGLPDLPMNCFTPSASSSPTRKRTSVGRLDYTFSLAHESDSQLVTKESMPDRSKEVLISASKGDVESSLMLASGDSTFVLPSQGSRCFVKMKTNSNLNIPDNSSEMQSTIVLSSVDVPAVRRSTRIKGLAESSLMLATCNSTFELPSHVCGSFIKTEPNTEPENTNNTTYLQSNHTSYRDDMSNEQRNITIKTEKSSPTFSATESSKNGAQRVRRVAQRRAKTNASDLQLQSSNLTLTEASIRVLSGIDETTSICVSELPRKFVASAISTQEITTNIRTPSSFVPTGGIDRKKEEPTDVREALPAYFSQAVNMTDDKENILEEFGTASTKLADRQLQTSFKSRIPVPTKQLVCREKLVSKIPVSFKFRKAGPGSNTRTATTKQWSANKVIPFQFTAKPATVTNKQTVQVGAFASHREKAAADRRMTARCVALKSAPNDRIGKKVKRQKLYHEMVRTNRTHELMLRRNI